MKPIVAQFLIPAPTPANARELPPVIRRLTLGELCAVAGIPQRVSEQQPARVIAVVEGDAHFLVKGGLYVGVGEGWSATRLQALRTLEVLAHSFHDYAARECVCGRGLFAAPSRQGRPPKNARAMSARERMASMRQRKRSVAA